MTLIKESCAGPYAALGVHDHRFEFKIRTCCFVSPRLYAYEYVYIWMHSFVHLVYPEGWDFAWGETLQ